MRPELRARRGVCQALVALALLLGGCSAAPRVVMHVHGNTPDALVTINDRYVGKVGELSRRGIALPPGEYRVTIEQPGYFPHDELVAVDEEPVELKVELTPVPD